MSFVIPFAFSSVYSVNTFLQATGKLCILYCSGESKSCAMEIFFCLCWKGTQIFSAQIICTWKFTFKKCFWIKLCYSNCMKREKYVDQMGKTNLLGNEVWTEHLCPDGISAQKFSLTNRVFLFL